MVSKGSHGKIFLLALLILISIVNVTEAQCVMCKAEALQNENSEGLNNGILYLAAIPYSILALFGIYIYRNERKKKKNNKKKNNKKNEREK